MAEKKIRIGGGEGVQMGHRHDDECDCEGTVVIGIQQCPYGSVAHFPVPPGEYNLKTLKRLTEALAEIYGPGITTRFYQGLQFEVTKDDLLH